jgi:hypothetical protein
MIKPAVQSLELGGYEVKNHADKVRQRLSEFIDTEEIHDGNCHYPIDKFWIQEDIILNLMDEPSSYIYRTFLSDLLVNMQRYYEKGRLDKVTQHIEECVCRVYAGRMQISIQHPQIANCYIASANLQ